MLNYGSEIVFYSEDKEQLEEMRKVFAGSEEGSRRSFQGLKFLARHYFPDLSKEGDYNDVDDKGIRFSILDLQKEIGTSFYSFWLFAKTEKEPKIGLFNRIVKEHYPNVKIAYCAYNIAEKRYTRWDESELFFANDFFLAGTTPAKGGGEWDFGIDFDDLSLKSEKELVRFLKRVLPFRFETSNDLQSIEDSVNKELAVINEKKNRDYRVQFGRYTLKAPDEYEFLLSR